MTQSNRSINSHIEDYLNYYCELSHAPGFAVLLKGQWGSGKTWLINKFREKLKEKNHKCLYISLYGMTTTAEISEAFFQQLHPVLSSKGMAITAKVLKALLKGMLKIDLNDDGRDDGTLNLQIPDINLPEYLKDTDKSILIFDDLERCKIDIDTVLGYINYFVEHQDLKVVIVANEDKLIDNNNNYQIIKEKLIGKTFSVSPDFEGALENFITLVNNSEARNFLSNNIELIQHLYDKAEYENLRNLKQILLDFERIFKLLPEKARNKPELLQDLLRFLMVFSIEIKRGKMLPKDISRLPDEYSSAITKQAKRNLGKEDDNDKQQSSLEEVLSRYTAFNIHIPFPSSVWWQVFFDKGIVDTQELEKAILNSIYFQDENTPSWVKLWYYFELPDDDFEVLLKTVASEYRNKQFVDFGVIKHITGLFLKFSDVGLYGKSKEEILNDSKLYLNYLKDNNQLSFISPSIIEDLIGGYGGLGFQGAELGEFKEFCSYIDEVVKLAIVDSLPKFSDNLLITMQSDMIEFYRMLCPSNSQNTDETFQIYAEFPVLKYIKPTAFLENILLMKHKDQRFIFSALPERYKRSNLHKELIEELEWLKDIQMLLVKEINCRKGKVSGYCLQLLNKDYLSKAIKMLETNNLPSQINQ